MAQKAHFSHLQNKEIKRKECSKGVIKNYSLLLDASNDKSEAMKNEVRKQDSFLTDSCKITYIG